jgi:hypothetical protein
MPLAQRDVPKGTRFETGPFSNTHSIARNNWNYSISGLAHPPQPYGNARLLVA